MRKISLNKIEENMAAFGSGICLMFIMIFTVISVYGRYVMGADLIPGTYNMIERIFFPLLVLWAIPIAHKQGTFPRLDFVTERFPGTIRRPINIIIFGVELLIYVVVTWFTFKYAIEAFRIGQKMNIGTVRWPVYPILAMVPLAMGMMSFEIALLFVKNFKKITS
ncbi:TRAP transporter small permease [Metallumcola ferriviriculae]|uniref:TRAP transporter small permease n=1 Tax=Metallumcola ferriviriculae TaxID=3039180 RepID=A0AAU0UQ00_9FIRM|nr:TRAP transporter small permease [Desulfitibacteraceae bacterium MK1]